MDYWFRRPSDAIDAREEFQAIRTRDTEAWAMLAARLAAVTEEPRKVLKQDAVKMDPDLGFFRFKDEAMVYRLQGVNLMPQVVAAGRTSDAFGEGALIHEAVWRIGKTKNR